MEVNWGEFYSAVVVLVGLAAVGAVVYGIWRYKAKEALAKRGYFNEE